MLIKFILTKRNQKYIDCNYFKDIDMDNHSKII